MKIAIMCKSLLINESLKIFLSHYIVSYSKCDIVISDHHIDTTKPLFLMNYSKNSNIQMPFSSTSLLLALEKFYKLHTNSISHNDISLEQQAEILLKEYTQKMFMLFKDNQ